MTREYKDDDVVGRVTHGIRGPGPGYLVRITDLDEKWQQAVKEYLPTIHEAERLRGRIADLEAENARLVERYDECLDRYMERGL